MLFSGMRKSYSLENLNSQWLASYMTTYYLLILTKNYSTLQELICTKNFHFDTDLYHVIMKNI